MEDKEMFWTILWIALGVTCLYLAGRILTKVDVAKLGKYSSRFLAVFLAFLGYYGVTALSNIVPQLTLNPVRFEFFKFLPRFRIIPLVKQSQTLPIKSLGGSFHGFDPFPRS